ncbi:MAG TPA: hypothetical protein VG758_23570 [Hyphomicrobiaceae bacterium]|jgi:hypothetical protein|nr:hypothetical protein [Hyphomicrobiaceae bacterium]
MRTLLSIAIFVSGIFALNSAADAARYDKRAKAPAYGYSYSRGENVCEANAKHEDPSGVYAGYPCWAREAFGRGTQGGGRGGRR